MADKEKLGRKILDLIEENKINIHDNEEVVEVDLDKIHPNPEQPRVVFNQPALDELARSIQKHGVIQPVILKRSKNSYVLVAGERRVRASKIAGRQTVPAIIRDYNAIYLAEIALLENLQRENLTPIEEAVAYKRILKEMNMTHLELSKKLGKSRSYVTNIVGLLSLPIATVEVVNNGQLNMGHARVLSKLKDEKKIIDYTDMIVRNKLTVRQVEAMVKRDKVAKYDCESKKKNYKISGKTDAEEKLSSLFSGTNVKVSFSKKAINIEFDSKENLIAAVNKLGD